jgi:hypothetical protein
MARPEQYPRTLCAAFAACTAFNVAFGSLALHAFGPRVREIVVLDLGAGWPSGAVSPLLHASPCISVTVVSEVAISLPAARPLVLIAWVSRRQ